jgi:hypothetical protein
MRRSRHASSLLGVAAISSDGLLVTSTGSYVHYLQTGSVNPFVIDSPETERISNAFAQIAARLPDGQSLQIYADARACHVENLLADERGRCEHAAGVALDQGRAERADALRARSMRPPVRPFPACACSSSLLVGRFGRAWNRYYDGIAPPPRPISNNGTRAPIRAPGDSLIGTPSALNDGIMCPQCFPSTCRTC